MTSPETEQSAWISPCVRRITSALVIALLISVVCSYLTEDKPDSVMRRGDFPAFYTLAHIAHSTNAILLYDIALQQRVQNSLWPSLNGTLLPAAYPPYVAYLLQPMVVLGPDAARLVWTLGMIVSALVVALLLCKANGALHGAYYVVVVSLLMFSPFFLGIIGSQISALSVLLYAAILYFSQSRSWRGEVCVGLATGLWMYKPHYALSVVCILLSQGRWRALLVWGLVASVLWLCGAQVLGVTWVQEWMKFAANFSDIDRMTNAYQMTGLVPLLYEIGNLSSMLSRTTWLVVEMIVGMMVPFGLGVFVLKSRECTNGRILPFLALGPLVVLFAPAVNFYDLSLLLVPLAVVIRPSKDMSVAVILLLGSQLAMLLKGQSYPGVSFALGLFMSLMVYVWGYRLIRDT